MRCIHALTYHALISCMTLALGITLLMTHVATAKPQMHPDYPDVRLKLANEVLPLKAGVLAEPIAMPWRLFIPTTKDDATLPLVVGLHGAGSRGEDNVKPMTLFRSFIQKEMQEKYPCFVLAPQIKIDHSWVKHTPKFANINVTQAPITQEMLALFALVEQTIKDYPIDPKRIYIVGQSMGGFGTWDAITRKPDLWAAAVPICGGGDPQQLAKVASQLPIWAWHGSNDPTVPTDNTRTIIKALEQAGGKPRYTEPNVGHGAWVNAFKEPKLYEWLFSQSRK